VTLDTSTLTRVDPLTAATMNQVAETHWSLELPADEKVSTPTTFGLDFGSAQSLQWINLELLITGKFGQLKVVTEPSLIDELSDVFIPSWRKETVSCLPLEWRAIIVFTGCAEAAALEELVTDINATFSARNCLRKQPSSTLTGTFSINGSKFALYLDFVSVTDEAANLLVSAKVRKSRLNGMDPDFVCRLRLPSRRVAFSSYANLQKGDVIISKAADGEQAAVIAELPGIIRFSANIQADGTLKTISESHTKQKDAAVIDNITIETEETPAESDMQQADDQIHTLPVTLDFLLESHRLTLAELRALRAGNNLDLHIDLNAPLVITANGARVGLGHLIQIGDHIGVQITQWPGSPDK
jgi:type III secretion protein Q